MNKMKWISVHLSFLLAVVLLGVSGAQAAKYVIRLGHIDPVNHPHNKACLRFAELVKERTSGEVEVQVYPAGQIGKAPNLMEQVQMGSVQMFQGGVGWWGSSLPDYWLVASNFVYDSAEHNMAVMKGAIGDRLAAELLDKVGVRVLTQGLVRNPRNLLTMKPVRNLEDLKGMKIRVPPMANWMVPWKALGANPTPMPLTETFLGLQQGVVEGVEHGLPQLYLNNYSEVAKNLILTHHQYETAGFFISEDFFSRLPTEYQKVIEKSALEAEALNNELQPQYLEDARVAMERQGVQFIEIDTKPWYEKGRKIMKEVVVPELHITPGLIDEIWAVTY
ncbi:MAG: TRAP transporter substrate-binding protein [Desulfopila sp.]